MSEPTEPAVPDASADPEAGFGIGRIRHLIELNTDADRDQFEDLMFHEIFRRVDTQEEDAGLGTSDQHSLLASEDTGRTYVWEVRMLYVIHQTATPQWLLNRAERSFDQVSDEIGAFGQRTVTEVLFDVRAARGVD